MVDLSPCTEWIRFVDIEYQRPEEIIKGEVYPPQRVTTVIWIPNIWDHIPDFESALALYKEIRPFNPLPALVQDEPKSEAKETKSEGKEIKSEAQDSKIEVKNADEGEKEVAVPVKDESKEVEEEEQNDSDVEIVEAEKDEDTEVKDEESTEAKVEQDDKEAQDAKDAQDVKDAQDASNASAIASVDPKVLEDLKAKMRAEIENEFKELLAAVDGEAEIQGKLDAAVQRKMQQQQEEEAKKLEVIQREEKRQARHLAREQQLEPKGPAFVFARREKSKSLRCTTVALSTMVDYSPEDALEKTFEVSLFGEFFIELLQLRFGQAVLDCLMANLTWVKRENDRKQREAELAAAKAAAEKEAREKAEQEKAEREKAEAEKAEADKLAKEAKDSEDVAMADGEAKEDEFIPLEDSAETRGTKRPAEENHDTGVTKKAKVDEVAENEGQEDEEEEDDGTTNYETLKVKDLKALCKVRGLNQNGTKAVLIQRLKESDKPAEEKTDEPNADEEPKAEETLNQTIESEVSEKADHKENDVAHEKPSETSTELVKVAVKEVDPNPALTKLKEDLHLAFAFFDPSGVGHLASTDVAHIIHGLGHNFSHRHVLSLVSPAAGTREKVHYKDIILRAAPIILENVSTHDNHELPE